MACGPLRLDGEAWRRIFELDAEHRVGSRVRVLDLHVQIGQGGPIGHILRDGDLVMRSCFFGCTSKENQMSPGILAG